MEVSSVKKYIIVVATAILLLAGGGFYYYSTQPQRRFEEITQKVINFTPENADFVQASNDLESLLSSSKLSLEQRAFAEVMLGDSLSEIDRNRATQLLKDIARNPEYQAGLRARALTYIADHYELDFIDENFAKEAIFTGEIFENFLLEAGGDERLAMRKLNEWSNALFPNVVANYRIAQWYGSEIGKVSSEDEKRELRDKMTAYLAEGDRLFSEYKDRLTPNRIGIVLEAKARALHLAGKREEAKRFFQMAIAEYLRPPRTIFQVVHLAQTKLYYVAFLARNYGTTRAEEIRSVLQPMYNYLSTPQPPEKRNVRLVSFLIAARDSKSPHYPAPDFNKNDIELISQIYPEFGLLINKLNLAEYVKGHPLESYIRQ